MPRALTAVQALRAAGVNVAAGADNLQDPFNPVGPRRPARDRRADGHGGPPAARRRRSPRSRRRLARPCGLAPGSVEAGVADLVALPAARSARRSRSDPGHGRHGVGVIVPACRDVAVRETRCSRESRLHASSASTGGASYMRPMPERYQCAPPARRLAGAGPSSPAAARGIGAEIARTFRGEGAEVVLIDIASTRRRRQDVARCRGRRRRPRRRRRRRSRDDQAAIDALGGIDILVNNAGILQIRAAARDHRRRLGPDLRRQRPGDAAHHPGRRAQAMIAAGSGGTIVNMASMGGKVGLPNQAHYAASKAAVIASPGSRAMELGAHGITVNCICPGYVLTEMGAAHPHPRDGRRVVGEVAARPARRAVRRRQHGAVPRLGRGRRTAPVRR